VAILAWAYVRVKFEPKTIEVKGSARKVIESDLITWSATVTARDSDLTTAYDRIKTDADRVAGFLREKGVPDKEVTLNSIATQKVYLKEAVKGTNQVEQTNKIDTYVLTQVITVESPDMKRVAEVARLVTSLINEGIEVDSGTPSYLYTKLSELKIDMLAEATKDATARAGQIVVNANGTLGKLVEAKMGVMQINPKNSSATSAEGNNDTTSLEKEITAIVTARYELRSP
jgi:uncharacterized protein